MRAVLAVALAATVLIAGAGPAAAYTTIKESGSHGDFYITDTSGSPWGVCQYGKQVPPDYAWFKWMKLTAPVVYAPDRNSAIRDHMTVSWQFKIQALPFGSSGKWQTVASSNIQKATAYEDQAAPFTATKVYWKPNRTGTNAGNLRLRALVIIKWFKPGGALYGLEKLPPDYYLLKMPWGNAPSGAGYCQDRASAG